MRVSLCQCKRSRSAVALADAGGPPRNCSDGPRDPVLVAWSIIVSSTPRGSGENSGGLSPMNRNDHVFVKFFGIALYCSILLAIFYAILYKILHTLFVEYCSILSSVHIIVRKIVRYFS